jgi:hypothetical protein
MGGMKHPDFYVHLLSNIFWAVVDFLEVVIDIMERLAPKRLYAFLDFLLHHMS